MTIDLRERTKAHVKIYFDRTKDEEIQRMCPQKAKSLAEALEDFDQSIGPDSTSFGRTIYADGQYIGDVWCFAIHEEDEPEAMLSCCIFEKKIWGRGAATEAVRLFLREITEKFSLNSIGAFAFMENAGSMRVLEKNGFRLRERFMDNGGESGYFQLNLEAEK